jgi:UPF0716 family protein affecting phage T7 exclusion
MAAPSTSALELHHVVGFAAAILVTFVVGLVVLRVLLVRLPADWFVREEPSRSGASRTARRIAGALLVLVGIALLVLPGPGMLVVAIGIALFDSPRKKELLAKLLTRPTIGDALDRARARAKKEPFVRP